MSKENLTSEKFYQEGLTDFFNKFPELNNYDVWVRLGQSLIQFSNTNDTNKIFANFLANTFVKVRDQIN